jgi:uncharacterized protein with HEPN domain
VTSATPAALAISLVVAPRNPFLEKSSRAAILMHLTSIAEQFDKLLHSGELKILGFFEKEDIKGSYELRNFIAHDYEGVNLHIIEDVIRYRLPVILKATNQILQKEKQ